MNTPSHPFVAQYYEDPADYKLPLTAPPLIAPDAKDITAYNLFDGAAPDHTRKYMIGLDVIGWHLLDGTERSQLIINQKAGALVLLWEPVNEGARDGVWLFLQETYRGPHAKDPNVSVADILARQAYEELGVWSLEAPAGSLNYVDGKPSEEPAAAAARELTEETGLTFTPDAMKRLLDPAGLHIAGDISTKLSHLFLADLRNGQYDPEARAVEADENIGGLLAFRVNNYADIKALVNFTKYDSSTTPALLAAVLEPEIAANLSAA